jgi:hypothetical protein
MKIKSRKIRNVLFAVITILVLGGMVVLLLDSTPTTSRSTSSEIVGTVKDIDYKYFYGVLTQIKTTDGHVYLFQQRLSEIAIGHTYKIRYDTTRWLVESVEEIK